MSHSVILSIVIPVYNVEKYLENCLNSIIDGIDSNANGNSIEVIIVNDGSQDSSERICLDYVNKYEYIRYIYQKNKGLSGARNTGIKLALGKYILFVDSDDRINGKMLNNLIETSVMDCDVFFLNAVKWYPDDNNKLMEFGEYYIRDEIVNKPCYEVLRSLTKFRKFPGSAWNKMVKRNFILKYNLLFEEGIYSEDLEWSIRLFNSAKSYGYLEGIFYYYRQGRVDSITGTLSYKNVNALIYLLEKYSDFNFSNNIKSSQFSFLSYEYLVLLYLLGKLDLDYSVTIKKVYKIRSVLLKSHKILYKILYFLISVFGVRLSSKVLSKIKG